MSFSAVIFARSAARAAVKSLAVTRQATELQLRPWLELIPETARVEISAESVSLTVRFVAKNLGRLVISDLRIASVFYDKDPWAMGSSPEADVIPLALASISNDGVSTIVMPEGEAVVFQRITEKLSGLHVYTVRVNDGPPGPSMFHLRLAVSARYRWGSELNVSEFVKVFAVSAVSEFPGPDDDITSHPFRADRGRSQVAEVKGGRVIVAD